MREIITKLGVAVTIVLSVAFSPLDSTPASPLLMPDETNVCDSVLHCPGGQASCDEYQELVNGNWITRLCFKKIIAGDGDGDGDIPHGH